MIGGTRFSNIFTGYIDFMYNKAAMVSLGTSTNMLCKYKKIENRFTFEGIKN